MVEMGLGLSNLCYKTYGKQILPFFLNPSLESELSFAIRVFEENLGERMGEIPFDLIENLFEDRRVGRGVIHALMKMYKFKKPDISQHLSSDTLSVLKSLKIENPADLRQMLFEWVNRRYGGFVPTGLRQEALREFSREIGIPFEDLEKILWADEEEHYVLTRNGAKPDVMDLIGVYNFEVLETLISNSKAVSLTVECKEMGKLARVAIKQAKRYSVLCDIFVRYEHGDLEIRYYGPRELFGRATRFGRPLSYALFTTLSVCEKLNARMKALHVDLVLGKREYFYEARGQEIPYMKLPERYSVKESMFDSKVEEHFYWAFSANKPRGWDIVREPLPIILEGRIIVPDFVLKKNGKSVFVEIVGYWRKEYISKKMAQVEILRKNNIPMILIVNKKYADLFSKMNVHVFPYVRRGNKVEIPYGSIIRLLEKL